jgi:hypothetical protein
MNRSKVASLALNSPDSCRSEAHTSLEADAVGELRLHQGHIERSQIPGTPLA